MRELTQIFRKTTDGQDGRLREPRGGSFPREGCLF